MVYLISQHGVERLLKLFRLAEPPSLIASRRVRRSALAVPGEQPAGGGRGGRQCGAARQRALQSRIIAFKVANCIVADSIISEGGDGGARSPA